MNIIPLFEDLGFGIFGLNPKLEKYFKDPLEGINIDNEYKLIQKKESSLSANMRNLVVRKYEKLNIEIEE